MVEWSTDLPGILTLLKYSEKVKDDVELYGFRLCCEMACKSKVRATYQDA
jgi:hypothetical protein